MTKSFLVATAFFTAYAASQSTSASSTNTTANSTVDPSTLTTSAPGVISPLYALTGYDKCSAGQITAIQNGFSDMIHMLMSDQIFGTYPAFDWNSAVAQEFWGSYERNNGFRSEIVDNLNRAASTSYQWWLNPFASRLHVRCDDPLKECPCVGPSPGTVLAYNIGGNAEINFCPGYFALPDLATVMVYQPNDLWEFIDAFYNKASCWAHELMHIRAIGHPASFLDRGVIDQPIKNWPGITYNPGIPAINRYSYGSPFTKWAAQSDNVIITDAIDNADNYALFATAYYIQKNLGYYPHLRQVAISPTGSSDILSSDVDGPSEANLSAAGFVDDSPYNYNIYCYTHFD